MRAGLLIFPLLTLLTVLSAPAGADPVRVLFFNGTHHHPTHTAGMRQEMSDWLNSADGGQAFRSTYVRAEQRGRLAPALAANPDTQVLILDLMNRRSVIGPEDMEAIRQFHASGRRAIMLDGSFGIRNMQIGRAPEVDFPGVETSSAALLANQVLALSKAGGGILIGTDHDGWQAGANDALSALVQGARFRGTTNPSQDGQFLGDVLLTGYQPVRPIILLRHWESVPNQGEAPVGAFTDYSGAPVQLFSLVEAADKPGGGRKRPYISANFDPGSARFDINSELAPEPQLPDNMPTRKSLVQ